ncbi:hypothetical protein C2845_PM04G11690 [Panicum miliaceum]|uniref:Uncharacterized protein n=1 Tax=Panicum miliaceum TaxID=4540 RepID=A0A3L6QMJ8_PANMI|nr:hypothetical protein C2845_PM04G11690 [Panicum miliaceum]
MVLEEVTSNGPCSCKKSAADATAEQSANSRIRTRTNQDLDGLRHYEIANQQNCRRPKILMQENR